MFFSFFSPKGLSCVFNNFLGPPRARFNHHKGLIALPMDYRILQKKTKMSLLTVLKESTVWSTVMFFLIFSHHKVRIKIILT